MDDWNFRDKIDGFGINFPRLSRHPSQEGPEYAAARHQAFMRDIDALKLLTLPVSGKKDRQVIEFLYRNSKATMKDLRDLTRDWSLSTDAIRKTIERINNLFLRNQIPLRIDRERGSTGFERVWLDIII